MQIGKAVSEIHELFCSGHLGCSGFWLTTGLLGVKWLIKARVPEEEPSADAPALERALTKGILQAGKLIKTIAAGAAGPGKACTCSNNFPLKVSV